MKPTCFPLELIKISFTSFFSRIRLTASFFQLNLNFVRCWNLRFFLSLRSIPIGLLVSRISSRVIRYSFQVLVSDSFVPRSSRIVEMCMRSLNVYRDILPSTHISAILKTVLIILLSAFSTRSWNASALLDFHLSDPFNFFVWRRHSACDDCIVYLR